VPPPPSDLKSSCPLGPIKEPRYTILFTQKIPASESPPGSPMRPLWREIPLTGRFCVSVNMYLLSFPQSPR